MADTMGPPKQRGAAHQTWLMALALGLLLAVYAATLRSFAAGLDGWIVGDWLVNYDAGFVRRGLPGALLLPLADFLELHPVRLVVWLQTLLYGFLFIALVALVRGKNVNIWFAAFLFSPCALLLPVYDPGGIGRKDLLFFAILVLYVWRMRANGVGLLPWVAFSLGAIATLSHELFVFLVPYFFLARVLHGGPARHHFRAELSLAAGCAIAVLLVFAFGLEIVPDTMCGTLLHRGLDPKLCEGVISYRATTVRDAILETVTRAREEKYLQVYPVAFILGGLPLVPFFWPAARRARLSRAVLFGAAATAAWSLPLFALAIDWGRLLHIHAVALSVLIAAFLLEEHHTRPNFFDTRRTPLRIATIACVAAYLTTWSVRHCCTDRLDTGIVTLQARLSGQAEPAAERIQLTEGEDAAVIERIRQAFAADPLLVSVPIEVDSRNGLIRLMSNETDREQRERAVALAKQIEGVRQVEDRMK